MSQKKYTAYANGAIKYKQPKIQQNVYANEKLRNKSVNKIDNSSKTNKNNSNSKSIQIKSFLALSEKEQDSCDMTAVQRCMPNTNRSGNKSAGTSRPKDNKTKTKTNKDTNKQLTNKQKYETKKFQQLTTTKKSIQNQSTKSHSNSATKTTAAKTAYQTIDDQRHQIKSSQLPNQQTLRLQNLKKYLHQNNQKIDNLKKISDEHVINQLSVSQKNLHMKIVCAENQAIDVRNRCQRQVQEVRKNYQLVVERKDREIDGLKMQLKEERQVRVKSDMKLKQNQVIIKCIKDKLAQREKQLQSLHFKYEKQRESSKLLQDKLNILRIEKNQMKKMAEGALSIVREQITQIANEQPQSYY